MKLSAYLEEQDETPSAFASRIGKSHSTVLRWIDGTMLPSGQSVREVFEATGGKVTASDLYQQTSEAA